MKSVEKETGLVRKLLKEKALTETRVNKKLAEMRNNVLLTEEKCNTCLSEKLELDDRVKDLNSQLEAAWKAVNDEKNLAKRENRKYKLAINDTNHRRKDLQRKKDMIEKKLMAADKEHKFIIHEKYGLESKIIKMSAHLKEVESKRQKMHLTIKEGSKSYTQLRKKLEDVRNANIQLEISLKEKGKAYEDKLSVQCEEWKSKLAEVEAKYDAKIVEKDRQQEARIRELEGAIAIQKVAFMGYS